MYYYSVDHYYIRETAMFTVSNFFPSDLCQHVQCKYGARCEDGSCICPIECPRKREAICGSDKITYQNECIMRKVCLFSSFRGRVA